MKCIPKVAFNVYSSFSECSCSIINCRGISGSALRRAVFSQGSQINIFFTDSTRSGQPLRVAPLFPHPNYIYLSGFHCPTVRNQTDEQTDNRKSVAVAMECKVIFMHK